MQLRPDIELMDVRMPEVDGIEATRRLVSHGATASTKVLMLTTFDLDEYVFGALRAGASGFLLKDLAAVQVVTRDPHSDRWRRTARALDHPAAHRRVCGPREAVPGMDLLTPRELGVLRLVARGLSNAEIAKELNVGEATVKTHVARVLMKLGIGDRVQAVVLAYESGLVTRRRST